RVVMGASAPGEEGGQAARGGGLRECLPLTGDPIGHLDPRVGKGEPPEQVESPVQGQPHGRPAAEVEEVDGQVDGGKPLLGRRSQGHPLPQGDQIGAAGRVEDGHDPIEDGGAGCQRLGRHQDLRVAVADVGERLALQADHPGGGEEEGPGTVPVDREAKIWIVEGSDAGDRELREDPSRQRRRYRGAEGKGGVLGDRTPAPFGGRSHPGQDARRRREAVACSGSASSARAACRRRDEASTEALRTAIRSVIWASGGDGMRSSGRSLSFASTRLATASRYPSRWRAGSKRAARFSTSITPISSSRAWTSTSASGRASCPASRISSGQWRVLSRIARSWRARRQRCSRSRRATLPTATFPAFSSAILRSWYGLSPTASGSR